MGGPGSGRPRLPNAVHELAGNPGKRALPEEPQIAPRKTVPSPPRYLTADGKREWRRVGRLLVDAGIYTDLDRTALTRYCHAFQEWREACRQLDRYGHVVAGAAGNPVLSPYARLEEKAGRTLERMLQQLGLTPATRHRVLSGPLATSAETGQADEEQWIFGADL